MASVPHSMRLLSHIDANSRLGARSFGGIVPLGLSSPMNIGRFPNVLRNQCPRSRCRTNRSGAGMIANMILTLISTERITQHTAAGHWRDHTIYMEAAGHAQHAPDTFAARDRFRRLTYRELISAADHLGAEMAARGIRVGQRVAVWLPSRVEIAVAMLACSRNGYVCCPSLHRDNTVLEVKALLERIRASVLIAQPGYGADAE